MGSNEGDSDEQPVHAVALAGFEMAKSETTVEQYAACVEAGGCTEPITCSPACTWGVEGKEQHPVNCLSWSQAKVFCEWAGARMCTEAEWEYAARSGGQDQAFPWGDAAPTCGFAVMQSNGGDGCGLASTWAVCSKTAGNSAQGVCDLAGNVSERVEDCFHANYEGAPNTGYPAWKENCESYGIIRGGSWRGTPNDTRASNRHAALPFPQDCDNGVRCCRSLP
jgi:formylglycine-generating enzyme required for sulfatase activity